MSELLHQIQDLKPGEKLTLTDSKGRTITVTGPVQDVRHRLLARAIAIVGGVVIGLTLALILSFIN